jgi:hypothetical protein
VHELNDRLREFRRELQHGGDQRFAARMQLQVAAQGLLLRVNHFQLCEQTDAGHGTHVKIEQSTAKRNYAVTRQHFAGPDAERETRTLRQLCARYSDWILTAAVSSFIVL